MNSVFPERIETERLLLTPLHEEDPVERYPIYAKDPGLDEVTEHLIWEPHDHVQETAEYFEEIRQQWQDNEAGVYAIYAHPEDETQGDHKEFAGSTSMQPDWKRCTAQTGMWLRKRFWGKEYSGERAAAMMHITFEILDLDAHIVTHFEENEKSRRAISKYIEAFGGRHEGLLRHFLPVDLEKRGSTAGRRYSVTKSEYEHHKDDRPYGDMTVCHHVE